MMGVYLAEVIDTRDEGYEDMYALDSSSTHVHLQSCELE